MLYRELDKEYEVLYQLNGEVIKEILTEPEYLTLDLHIDPTAEIITIQEILPNKWEWNFFKRDLQLEINLFFKELDLLLRSNILLFDALESLFYNTKNPFIKNMLAELLDALNRGEKIYPSLKKFEPQLGYQTLVFIKIAEETSTFGETIHAIAQMKEKQYNYRKKIISALRYPIILIASTLFAVTTIILFVIPKFKDLFINLNVDLPFFTQILFFLHDYFFLFTCFIILSIGTLFYIRNYYPKLLRQYYDKDKIVLQLPIIKNMVTNYYLTNFFLTIHHLLKAHHTIDDAIKYALLNIENRYLHYKINQILESIYQGETLTSSFTKAELFDETSMRLISSAEVSSNAKEVFSQLYISYESRQDDTIRESIKLIEPLSIVIFSLLVLFIALGVFIPLWNLNQSML
jgi:type II secretory pathway component PulF